MSDYNTEADNTVFGGYGEFDLSSTDSWTDEDWAAYDRDCAEAMAREDEFRAAEWAAEDWDQHYIEQEDEMAQYDAERLDWEYEAMAAQWDDDPNPYHGDYSEM